METTQFSPSRSTVSHGLWCDGGVGGALRCADAADAARAIPWTLWAAGTSSIDLRLFFANSQCINLLQAKFN
jgi:hypothetical protein